MLHLPFITMNLSQIKKELLFIIKRKIKKTIQGKPKWDK